VPLLTRRVTGSDAANGELADVRPISTDNDPHSVLADAPQPSGISLRAVIAGVIAEAALFWWVASSEISGNVYLICYSLLMPAVALLTAVVAANAALERWMPRLAFRRGEVLTVYVMLTCSLPVAGFGMMRFLVPSLVYPRYMQHETGGRWGNIAAQLPSWLAPKSTNAATGFFLGQPSVPWHAWTVPLLSWGALFLALIAAQLAITVLVRKQWIESERLTFPIVYLPLRMTQQGTRFFKDYLMWLGFAGPFVLQSLSALSYLYPWVPSFQLKANFYTFFASRPWSAFGGVPIGFYPIAIGLAYFIPTDVNFSCWFFYFLMRFLLVGAAALGLDTNQPITVSSFPFREEQAAGAWIAYAAVALWLGRRQLAQAYRIAAGRDRDDAAEGSMFRGAGATLILSLALIFGFGALAGLPLWLSVGIFTIYLLYVITAARVRAEVGTQWTFAPLVWDPNQIFLLGLGSGIFGARTLTTLAVMEGITVDVRGQPMGNQMESLKMAEEVGLSRRHLTAVIVIATLTGLPLAFFTSFQHWYHTGALTAKANWYHIYKVQLNYNYLFAKMDAPTKFNLTGLSAVGLSGVATVILALLRTRFAGWPFHPLGYVLSNTLTVGAFWLPMVMANVVKVVVLRYGGVRLYRRSISFFVGIILGDVLAEAGWSLAGLIGGFPVYQFLS
jgi:hypothetical protein